RTPFGLGLGRVLEVLLQVLLRLVVGGEVALLEGVLALLVGLLHALDGRGELLRVARAVATGPVTAVTTAAGAAPASGTAAVGVDTGITAEELVERRLERLPPGDRAAEGRDDDAQLRVRGARGRGEIDRFDVEEALPDRQRHLVAEVDLRAAAVGVVQVVLQRLAPLAGRFVGGDDVVLHLADAGHGRVARHRQQSQLPVPVRGFALRRHRAGIDREDHGHAIAGTPRAVAQSEGT